MWIIDLEQNSEEWYEARKGKITGSKLKDIITKRGKSTKIGVYQLIADRVATEPDDEDARDRGHRLEEEAIALFEEKMDKIVERVGLVVSADNANIALSPDGLIKIDGKYKEAVEVKCLNSARHIEVIVENLKAMDKKETTYVPNDIQDQAMQYFIVNPDLEKLHIIFYDPRIVAQPFVVAMITRDYWTEEQLELTKQYQIRTLDMVEMWVERLTF